MFPILRYLPKNLLSFLVGRLVALRFPAPISGWIIRQFIAAYGVNKEEIPNPIESYQSLSDFFIRDLKPGARPIGDGMVSPADGTIISSGSIDGDRLYQVKGIDYFLPELLQDEHLAQRFTNGSFATIYLAPPDYHHVHSPIEGVVREMVYIPGTLWPVNRWAVQNVPGVFARNERIVLVIEGEGMTVAVVCVGAFNVGCISLSFDELRTNQHPLSYHSIEYRRYQSPIPTKRGQRLATFNFGSTVVLLSDRSGLTFSEGKVRMGATL